MANFPSSLDSISNPATTDKTNSPSHGAQHTLENDILEALEAKVGIDASVVTTSHDHKLSGVTGSDKAASKTGSETLTNKTLTTPTLTSAVAATSFDMNGTELILDADGDTSITADTDDQIDIKINNADDFQLTANTLTALSGSSIATNTISETTAASGVTVDSLLIKDGTLPNHAFNSLFYQALINGGMDIWQRYTTVSDTSDAPRFTADRWYAQHESGTNPVWTYSQSTDVPSASGFLYSMKVLNTAANKQCALSQKIENKDAARLAGKNVTLSFYAKTANSEIANLRATVLAWTGTADTMTALEIDTWASDGTDPTFAASYTKEVAGSNLALTNSWQRFTIANIALDTASTNNYSVIIWVDDGTIASGDEFYITGVQLNAGDIALPFMPKSYENELTACRRYYRTSEPTSGVNDAVTSTSVPTMPFKDMRTTPTMTFLTGTGKVHRPGVAFYDASSIATGGDYTTITHATIGATGVYVTIFRDLYSLSAEL